jgi:DNA-binding HxlR family transcriptional regulator
MSSGLSALHKILKDETRSKVILLLNDKGALSYSDLMDQLGIVSTGLLNYHLKVLANLVQKDEMGQYSLTERGKLAYRLLQEFPEENNGEQKRQQRQFWIAAVIVQIVFLSTILTLYHLGYTDFGRLILYSAGAVASMILAYFGYKAQAKRSKLDAKETQRRYTIGFTIVGVVLGAVIGFAGPILIVLLTRLAGGPDLARVDGGGEVWVAVVVAAIVAGGWLGHWLGKKEAFQQKWAKRLGFY